MSYRVLLVWLLACGASAQAGECWLLSSSCIEGPETRNIAGFDVYRDCWRYRSEYECLASATEEEAYCGDLRAKGCSQIGSRCLVTEGQICTTYEQTYECPSDQPPAEQAVLDCGGQLFCLEGNCFDTGYAPNTNMAQMAALLSVMEAISEDMAADSMSIFKGVDRRCGIPLTSGIGALNCCKLDGWAQGAFECSANEELLADLRKAKRCHYVGTYCADKTEPGGICLLKKETYCCFGSKLSRIIAEQARLQIGRSWGTSKEPDCSGFTPEEVSQLDFEAMDLSEFYADVIASMPAIDAGDLQDRMTDRMNQLLP